MNILIEKNIMVPMRDGVKLATDVYRPAVGGLVPVLFATRVKEELNATIICSNRATYETLAGAALDPG